MTQSKNNARSRRDVIRTGLAGTAAIAMFTDAADAAEPGGAGPEAAPDAGLTPDQALAEIMAGNPFRCRSARGASEGPPDHPFPRGRGAMADRRRTVLRRLARPGRMVFDEPIGRLFVTRIAGNVTTPEIMASLEYAVAVLGIRAIVVMGHSSCGATKAAMHNSAVPGQISALFPALLPSVYVSRSDDPQIVTWTNAVIQAATMINASTVIETKVRAGTLKVRTY